MPGPRIVLIAAMDVNHVIGRDGSLPWHLPDDMAHFRRATKGKPVIMGRKTWESLSGPLPGRRNVVMTRRDGYVAAGAEVVSSAEDALRLVGDVPEVMVIGGREVYASFLASATELDLTMIHESFDGDVSFPAFDPDDWVEISRDDRRPDERNPHAFSFLVLQRR